MVFPLTSGGAASWRWLADRGIDGSANPHWFVEILVRADPADAAFQLNVYPEEWGIVFRRGSRVSSIRVTDVPFVHGLDDHRLLDELPSIENIGVLMNELERRFSCTLKRGQCTVTSNLGDVTQTVRRWLGS